MAKLDLCGKKFGKLTVVEEDKEYKKQNNIKGNRRYWRCKCECGNYVTVRTDGLTSGNTKSCGCIIANKGGDLTGQVFGKLTVLEKDTTPRKDKHVFWKCKCECGNTVSVSGTYLRTGNTKSCGCQNSLRRIIDITNQRFGKLTVLSYYGQTKNYRGSLWLCKCDCGNSVIRSKQSLILDSYSSCGCSCTSLGEKTIEDILLKNKIPFVKQKTFDSCRFIDTNALARFDFYINDKFLLEFDGQQHYFCNDYGYFTKENFIKIQEHDKIKNQWCEKNNIPLKRIPYTYLNKITLENILDDTFLVREGENTNEAH